ncbi:MULTISPECIES: ArsR/SmtB family transcription factor [unclassified Halomonas]|uniref:ArsR/SmtB family transcription factor n=1 Tax=unclassified Halomonas TaxID=2609666 RepID=UPI00047F87D7|nr:MULTISPECIES: winged helix-turn-helix domain-containing protein [unclassified Halomonas]PKH60776.1 ArsR family transcriptional regulator [Halomonas sp. Choline-3u-9]QGQ72158.1 winged helix-turn-helix transcriptional regulator [Halomonas sp. PA16-9]
MSEGPNIVRVAALIGDNARAEVLSALMSGRALTATELADTAGVTKQTISFHLGKLLDAGLITVEQQGRHRYFRLMGPEVASLLESLMGLAYRSEGNRLVTGPRDPALRKARICYDHLAGELGVSVYEHMLRTDILHQHPGGLQITEQGRVWFNQFGIDTDALASSKRSFCRECLDWSERRHHLAGALGSALLTRIQALGWAKREKNSRVIVFSAQGEKLLSAMLAPQSAPTVSAQQAAVTF